MKLRQLFKIKTVQIIFAVAVGLLGGFFGGRVLEDGFSQPPENADFACVPGTMQAQGGFQTRPDIQAASRAVSSRVLPSVVEIDVQESRRQSPGSGVLVKRAGNCVFVLTNRQIVGEAEELTVKLADGRSFQARPVGTDPKKDLALVMFNTEQPVPLAELGDSDALQVGDRVLAVGSPLGFHPTVTAGIVSAIGRENTPAFEPAAFTAYIQTDAAINRENSGGALVDVRGRVVGINSWIALPCGGNVGPGFAVPINIAKSAIEDLVAMGGASYGWLGIDMGSLSPREANSLYGDDIQGVFVRGVYAGSPAEESGILPGDLITAVNEEKITDSTQLLPVLRNFKPGARADFAIRRDRRRLVRSVNIAGPVEEQAPADQAGRLWPGLSVVQITPELRSSLDLPGNAGNLVIGDIVKGSPAGAAGLRAGDILRRVNKHRLTAISDFYQTLNEPDTREFLLEVTRQSSDLRIGLVK
jgi:S1-C subfamily serine protease